MKKSTVAIGGHFEKRDELKLPNGDTSTPSGFFISRVSRQQYSAIKKNYYTSPGQSKIGEFAAGLLHCISITCSR